MIMRPLQQYYEFMGVSLHCHHLTIQSQGNVRCVVRHDGTLVESNEYYPYGGLFSATASAQPCKYGSKELDRTNGLDLYDSEARWYDPLLGRTTTMDPLAEKYYGLSPYAWCAGNPVKFVDPDGNTISIIIEEGIYQYDYDNSSFVDSDGNIAQLDDAFFNQVLDALSILREGIVGNDLVKYISCNSGYNVFIKSSGTNGYNRQGANYSIDWNAELTEGGPSYFGIGNDYTRERPAYVGLGHEMAHVQDSWMGKVDDSIWYIANENTIVPKSEIYACSIENKIRAEHKIPMRTHFSYYKNETVCPKSSLFSPFCTYYLLRRGK